MDEADLANEYLGKAGRIVDSPTITPPNSAQHFVPERGTRLAIEPDRIEPATANHDVRFPTNARSRAERHVLRREEPQKASARTQAAFND
jgi:hypothetical protein